MLCVYYFLNILYSLSLTGQRCNVYQQRVILTTGHVCSRFFVALLAIKMFYVVVVSKWWHDCCLKTDLGKRMFALIENVKSVRLVLANNYCTLYNDPTLNRAFEICWRYFLRRAWKLAAQKVSVCFHSYKSSHKLVLFYVLKLNSFTCLA